MSNEKINRFDKKNPSEESDISPQPTSNSVIIGCARDPAVNNAGRKLMQAATTVEKDSLSFLATLMSFRIAINRFYISQNKGIGGQDPKLIFDQIIPQFKDEFKLTHKQKQRIVQLLEHTHSFMNRALKYDFKNDAVLDLLRPRGDMEDLENYEDFEDFEGMEKPKPREYIFFLIQNLNMDMSSFGDAYYGNELLALLPEDKAQEEKE